MSRNERVINKTLAICTALVTALVTAFGLPSLCKADTNVQGTITDITVYSVASGENGAYIVLTPAFPADTEGCTDSASNEIWIDFSDANGKTLYATVLAAQLAGQTLKFGVRGCGDNGQLPLVYSVNVVP